MEQLIISGANASGIIPRITNLGTEVRSVKIDLPLDEIGFTSPNVTLSGTLTGAYTFYNDTSLNLRFGTEDVYITTQNFSGEYSAIIRYLKFGDQTYLMNTRNMDAIPIPSRLR